MEDIHIDLYPNGKVCEQGLVSRPYWTILMGNTSERYLVTLPNMQQNKNMNLAQQWNVVPEKSQAFPLMQVANPTSYRCPFDMDQLHE
jgi:hypothetical protein